MLKSILDVSKGNGLKPVTIVLSAPFVAITISLWLLSILFFWIACIIGRKAAFDTLYGTAVRLGIRDN